MTLTQIMMAGATVILLAYDVYAALVHGLHDTISWQFVALSKQYPFIPFLLGLLAGHLTTQMPCS